MRITKTRRELGASEDVTLVCSAKQGDMAAFDELTKRYTPMIFRIAMRMQVRVKMLRILCRTRF